MNNSVKPRTALANGRLWGARHRDWAEVQEPQFTRAYEAVFDHLGVGPGMRYVDLGCGAGLAALVAARRGASVCGLDAAEQLLEIARARLPSADFRQGELEDLPFENGTFDLVTGFNAFQYAGDPVAAIAEARRVTRREGRVVVMTWGPAEGMEAASLVAALKPLLPPPPPGAPGPFALSDKAALSALAESAGLRPLAIEDVECTWRYPDLATGLRGLASAGIAVRAAENSSDAEVDRVHEAALRPFAQGDGSYVIRAMFRWLMAQA
ncbi:MAG: methyltransferase domain-containing protein [Pseudomonadota bacterium]|nr:methyltransferase domain-containing protein [Pseudomonadota bacterium]